MRVFWYVCFFVVGLASGAMGGVPSGDIASPVRTVTGDGVTARF